MQNIESLVLQLLRSGAMTPEDVAQQLKISWSTANGYLLKLAGEGKVTLTRKGRVNIYQLKTVTANRFQAPRWVKTKPLKQLSDELEQHFPENITAAQMIERERRRA